METTPHHPFQPPKAQLEVPVERGPRPKQVRLAAILMVIAGIVTFLSSAAIWIGLIAIPYLPRAGLGDYVSGIVSLAVMLILAWRIHAGRNWARWIFAILFALGMVGFAVSLFAAAAMMRGIPPTLWIVICAQTALQLIALFLMFGGEASR